MLLRSTLIYLPALLLPRVATFVLVIVATRLLPMSEYGLFALVTTVGEIAEGVTTNWVRIALVRLSSTATTFPLALWRATARVNRATTAVAILVVAITAFVLVPERPLSFALAVGCYVAAMSLLRFGLHVLQATRSRMLYAAIEAGRAAALLTAPVLAVWAIRPDFMVASLAGSAATALFGLWSLASARRRVVAGGAPVGHSDLMVFAAPIVTITALGYAIANVERLILQVVAGPAMVGGYAAGYALARQPFDVLGNAVNTGGFPHLVERYERDGAAGGAQAVSTQLELLLGLLLPAVALIAALRVEIAAAILPAAYRETAIAVMPWIAAGAFALAVRTYVFDNVFYVVKRSWSQLAYLAPAALTTIVVGLVAVPATGPLGAAQAFAGGSVVGLVVAAILAARLMALANVGRGVMSAALSAVAVALLARLGVSIAPQGSPLLSLGCGMAAGAAAFLASTMALQWRRTIGFASRLALLGRPGAP